MTPAAPKRPRGRPPLPDDERRAGSVEVRVTEAERADLERWAALDGAASVSEWLRGLAAKRGRVLERRER